MAVPDSVAFAACLAAGACLGHVLDRSRLTLDGVFRGTALTGDASAFRAWLLAAALLWVVSAAAQGLPGGAPLRPEPLAPLAGLLAGLAAGLAVSVLAEDACTLALGAGRSHLASAIGLAGVAAGWAAGRAGPVGAAFEAIRNGGPAELRESALGDVIAAPPWMLPLSLGAGALIYLVRQPVEIHPGRMEWPKAGLGLALAAAVVWTLGGRPAVALGLASWGLRLARTRDGWLPGGVPAWPEAAIRVAAGVVLGLSVALASGDPASRTLPGLAVPTLGGAAFVSSFGCGAFLMALLEWKMRGRPGAAPALGRGV